MYIAVLDYKNNCVDMIQLDDSLVPPDAGGDWYDELLASHGYDGENTCWMASETPISIRTLTFRPKEDVKQIREAQKKDGKSPKNGIK